jgi:hypothetical protein
MKNYDSGQTASACRTIGHTSDLVSGKHAFGDLELDIPRTANMISPMSPVVLRNLNAQYGQRLAKLCAHLAELGSWWLPLPVKG